MGKKMSFEGTVEYNSLADDYFVNWVEVDGRKLIDMLEEMGWEWSCENPTRIRVTVEVLDPGCEFRGES